MFELILYAIGFFLITVSFQYLLHKFRKNGNRGHEARLIVAILLG